MPRVTRLFGSWTKFYFSGSVGAGFHDFMSSKALSSFTLLDFRFGFVISGTEVFFDFHNKNEQPFSSYVYLGQLEDVRKLRK